MIFQLPCLEGVFDRSVVWEWYLTEALTRITLMKTRPLAWEKGWPAKLNSRVCETFTFGNIFNKRYFSLYLLLTLHISTDTNSEIRGTSSTSIAQMQEHAALSTHTFSQKQTNTKVCTYDHSSKLGRQLTMTFFV